MGTSRGDSRPLAVGEASVWPADSVGEAAVLAEFADEGTLESSKETTAVEPPAPARGRLRLFDPQTPLRDVARTVAIACLSAMALGASFAIGFGYIWNAPVAVVSVTAPEGSAMRTDGARTESLRTESPRKESPRTEGRDFSPGQSDGNALVRPARSTSAGTDVPAPRTEPRTPRTGYPPEASSSAALASTPMTSMAEVPTIEPALAVDLEPPALLSSAPAVPLISHRTDLEAVRRTIERYESAYSQKDIGALALVWPSVDVAGVEKAFASVDRQALTLTDCRVTTAGNLATAVCPGQVRYIGRVGGRQLQERQGTWTIALERNGDYWQFTRLNVR